jgi:hypothetical protein
MRSIRNGQYGHSMRYFSSPLATLTLAALSPAMPPQYYWTFLYFLGSILSVLVVVVRASDKLHHPEPRLR